MFAIISQQTPQQHKIYQQITRTAVGEILVLDILVKRCPDNTFTISIFRKKTPIRWTLYQVGLIHPKLYKGERFNRDSTLDVQKHYKQTETFQYTKFLFVSSTRRKERIHKRRGAASPKNKFVTLDV